MASEPGKTSVRLCENVLRLSRPPPPPPPSLANSRTGVSSEPGPGKRRTPLATTGAALENWEEIKGVPCANPSGRSNEAAARKNMPALTRLLRDVALSIVISPCPSCLPPTSDALNVCNKRLATPLPLLMFRGFHWLNRNPENSRQPVFAPRFFAECEFRHVVVTNLVRVNLTHRCNSRNSGVFVFSK